MLAFLGHGLADKICQYALTDNDSANGATATLSFTSTGDQGSIKVGRDLPPAYKCVPRARRQQVKE